MQRISVLVVLALLTFTLVQSKNHWNDLIPRGKEIDYRYEATVSAGTSSPDPFSSMFHLWAVLHVQAGKENDILLRLSDMNYTLDNGKESDFPKKTPIGIQDHLDDLTKPFRIVYDDNGLFKELGVKQGEPEHVLNIKKAIASLFQVDWNTVRLDSVKVHSFRKHEQGLHGNEEIMYTVIPKQKTLRIERMHHMRTSKHLYHDVVNSVNVFRCGDEFEDPLSHDSQKVYDVDKTENVLRRIENTGGIYLHPYRAKAPAFMNRVRQTLEMIEIHDTHQVMVIENETRMTSLQFIIGDLNAPQSIVLDKQPLVDVAHHLLEELLNHVITRKIEASKPDFIKERLPDRIQNVLKHFDTAMFDKLAQKLSEKQLVVLHQLLPYIGTATSTKVLIQAIKEKKMNDLLAIKALEAAPFFIVPNEQIITESDKLLDLEGVSPQVRNAARLAFGTLLQRTQKGFLRHHETISNDIVERYIKILIDKLKIAKTIDEKILCLNTLFNIKSPLLIKELRGAVNGEWWNDNNLRLKAMLALYPVVSKNHDVLFDLYHPILVDRTLPSDMRIIALHIILQSQPSLSCMINIYWDMLTETDTDLYQFYFSYMETLAHTKSPCDRRIRLQATQIMKYMQIPRKHSLTQYKKVDVFDRKINVGESLEVILADTKDSLLLRIELGKTIMNLKLKPIALYIRITGLHGKLLDSVKLNIKKQMKWMNLEQVIQNLSSLSKMENVDIELVLLKHGQVVFSDIIRKSNYDIKRQFIIDILKGYSQNVMNIDFDIFYKIHIPSDIGFLFMPKVEMPVITQLPLKISLDHNNNIITLNANGRLKETVTHVNGLHIHNSIARTWQTAAKISTYDLVLPINIDLNWNTQQDMLKISWKKSKTPEENIWLTRSYVARIVENFDYTKTDQLKKLNPNTESVVIIPIRKELNNHILKEIEDYNTGHTEHIQIFDSEDAISVDEISALNRNTMDLPSMIEDLLKNLQFDNDIVSHLLKWSKMETDLALLRTHKNKGILITYEPSRTNPISSIDLSIRLSHEITKESPSLLLPGLKINLKGSYALKREEDLVKRWDVSLNWDLNNGHTRNELKAQITRTIPGQTDYKICAEGTETYTETGITGRLEILMSSADEGKCKTDETSINILMKGERLPDQLKSKFNFPHCDEEVQLGVQNVPTHSCLTERTTIRKYNIEISSKNVPQEFQRKIESLLEFLKVKYNDHYERDVSNEANKDTIKILLTFPIPNNVVDITSWRDDHKTKLSALPGENLRRLGLFPDNLHFSNIQEITRRLGLVHTCSCNTRDILNTNNQKLRDVIGEDWILAKGDAAETPNSALWIKRVDNKLALKIVEKMHILLVLPVGDTFTLTLDGKPIAKEPLFSNEWLMLMSEKNYVVLLKKNCGTTIIYNTEEMALEVPKLDMNLFGKCL